MKIPMSMFTVIFALARCIGWIAQWREMISEPNVKIGRPRQLYVGNKVKEFVKIEDREESETLIIKKVEDPMLLIL